MKKPSAAGWARLLFYLLQFTWGLPVNIFGLFLYICCKGCRRGRFRNGLVTFWQGDGGLSLGVFIFVSAQSADPERLCRHEYGHTVQCLLLGPLYWPLIALPSAVWFNFLGSYRKKRRIPYDALYCERWATAWGDRWGGYR